MLSFRWSSVGVLSVLAGLPLPADASTGSREGPARSAPAPRITVRSLQEAYARQPSDSLAYLLARAYRDEGTIESRYRALELFGELRGAYEADPRYWWDLGQTLKESARFANARECLERAAALDPMDAQSWVEIARLRLRELLYHFDISGTHEMLQDLRLALARDPDHREALFLKSLALHLAKGPGAGALPHLTYEGKACLERILARNPEDVDAELLLAVHCLDLSQVEEADRHFRRGLALAPFGIQQVFTSSEWTAPGPAADRLGGLSPESRTLYNRAYWQHHDPTPLTLLNENQLEIWKRVVVSEFLFGKPEDGILGWETHPGRAFIRYGRPQGNQFDPGSVRAGAGVETTLPYAGLAKDPDDFKANLTLAAPLWEWTYAFRDLTFTLYFRDMNLSGRFLPTEGTARVLEVLRESAPVVFHDAPNGEIGNLHLVGVGVAGPGGLVHESIQLALPPWKRPRGDQWFERTRLEFVVRDSSYVPVHRDQALVGSGNVHHPIPDAQFLLITREVDLPPGRYTVTAHLRDEQSEQFGTITRPLVVRDYGARGDVEISDLELALLSDPEAGGPIAVRLGRSTVANPMGIVADRRNLDVYFVLYGLSEAGGRASYTMRYTVLPRDYILGYDHHVREGRARPEDLIDFAASGMGVGGITLSPRNYSDVRFPEELVAPGASAVPKGSRVDVSGLDPGEYGLIVTVTDLGSGRSDSARALFRVLTDAQLREFLTYRDRD